METNKNYRYPTLELKQEHADWAAKYFKVGDFAVTLTFNPVWPQHVEIRSDDVRHLIKKFQCHLVKYKLMEPKRELCRYTVFEKTSGGQYHAHMALENPSTCFKYSWELMDIWHGMRCSGSRKANKVKPIYDVRGWTGYMVKEKAAYIPLEVDFSNTYFTQ